MKKRTYALCMIVAVVSFLGFLVENIWCALVNGYVDNRSMFFPFLLGYGVAILLIYLLFGTPDHLRFLQYRIHYENEWVRILVYLGMVMLCVSIGEILLGTLVEKTCGFRWWNYSNIPLHITPYTSGPTSLAFGAIITFFMKFCFEPLMAFFERWNDKVLKITALLFMAIMVWDFLYAAYKMVKTKGTLIRWRWFLRHKF